MEFRVMLCGSLATRGVGGTMYTCICMAESIRYLPETITTLLINCTKMHKKENKHTCFKNFRRRKRNPLNDQFEKIEADVFLVVNST